MKRVIYFLLSLLGAFIPSKNHAQKMYSWDIFASYHNARKCVVAENKIYALFDGNLMSYNTQDSEVYFYNKTNKLHETDIEFIGFQEQLKKLLVIYQDGNIDIIRADERVINIPQYKDKNLNDKKINSVHIEGIYAFIATDFGVVVLNLDKEIIQNTYILNKKTFAATSFEGDIYAACSSGVYTGKWNDNLLDNKNWKQKSLLVFTQMQVFDGMLYGNNQTEFLYRYNGQDFVKIQDGPFQYLKVCQGKMLAGNNQKICIFESAHQMETITGSNTIADLSYGNGIFWSAQNQKGVVAYQLDNKQLIASQDTILPNSPIRDNFNFLTYQGNRLLAVGGSLNYYKVNVDGTVMLFENDKWTNFQEGKAISDITHLPYRNTVNIAQDPADPHHHFVTSARLGLYEFQDAKLIKHYSTKNSRLNSILPGNALEEEYVSTSGAIYDANQNLWFINNEVDTLLNIIKKDGTWIKIFNENLQKLPTCDYILFDQKERVWINSRRYKPGLFMLDYNGTLEDESDDTYQFRSNIINQDGIEYKPDFFYCMAEDKNGAIWVGTSLGVFVIDNPDDFQEDDFHYTQIKVPRNDGTNYADYLLNNTTVTSIAIDGANRKWIGTSNGVYLVSADGLETIYHFTKENSPLLSNNINAIAINPENGAVMIATEKGLNTFYNDASEPVEKMEKNEVKVYPNPVKPDYNGYITIKGLTANSSIKITSSTGQLIYGGVSHGGIFTWNGRNSQGKRVATGVYHVLATTEKGDESVVCKIVFIH